MRIYHQRMRDGERIAWCNDDGRLRRLTGDTAARQSVAWLAPRILADATGGTLPIAVVYGFAAWLESRGDRWDMTDADVRSWVEMGGWSL